jgi:hypothetical protein
MRNNIPDTMKYARARPEQKQKDESDAYVNECLNALCERIAGLILRKDGHHELADHYLSDSDDED